MVQQARLPNTSEIVRASILDFRRSSFGPNLGSRIETSPVGGAGLMMAIQKSESGSHVFLYADRSKNPGVILPTPQDI